MPSTKDISGIVFGRLMAISRAENRGNAVVWNCKCSCGNNAVILKASLLKGATKSCGCFMREVTPFNNLKHGHSKRKGKSASPEYQTWLSMMQRCTNDKNRAYSNYGGRGITVCKDWLEFTCFLNDMGHRPPGMSLDRIDNNKGYNKDNCRWATRKQQSRNMRSNRKIEFNGHCMTAIEWSEKTGITLSAIRNRIMNGWSVQYALTIPSNDKNPVSVAAIRRNLLREASLL